MERPVQHSVTVWFASNEIRLRNTFRCVYCGKPVMESTGEIRYIMQGDVHADQNTVVVRCKGTIPTDYGTGKCNTEYIVHL